MIHLNNDFYHDLAQELYTQLYDKNSYEGVIELLHTPDNGKTVDVFFAFNANDFTIDSGLNSLHFLIIALQGTKRHSTDFDSELLNQIMEL